MKHSVINGLKDTLQVPKDLLNIKQRENLQKILFKNKPKCSLRGQSIGSLGECKIEL